MALEKCPDKNAKMIFKIKVDYLCKVTEID